MSAIKFNLTLRDFHRAHKARGHAADTTVKDLTQYKLILDTLGDILGRELINTGQARFPASTWVVKMFKRKAMYLDRKASREAGEKVYGFNDHTDGFTCYSELHIAKKLNKKRTFYRFSVTREIRRDRFHMAVQNNKSIIYNYPTVVKPPKE